MQFQTWPFLVFFVVTYGVYLVLRRSRYWLPWLLFASYFFYGWWNPLYLLLIAYSTFVDYSCVSRMRVSPRKKFWLAISLINNLGLLCFFKYAFFLTENVNALLASLNVGLAIRTPDILLPVGISFYTFQSMSYTIDFYRDQLDHEPSFLRFATFVSFFPQLVAGPIERASHLLPQFRSAPPITRGHLSDGLSLFLTGLVKKICLADFLAGYVDLIYANPAQQSASSLAAATFAFAWQIYFDFSGYTDMARGVARVMGFNLMLNFNHPYLATSLKDFWSRWHISLSTWFRDYLYIPLGGSHSGRWRTYRNLFVTMLVSGIWHGAAWTFVVWGALHGLAYLAFRPFEGTSYWQRTPVFMKRATIFSFVCLTWVFFRADTVNEAVLILQRIATGVWTDPRMPLLAIFWILVVWTYQWFHQWQVASPRYVGWIRVAAYTGMMMYLSIASGQGNQPFIYFQF